MKLTSNINSSRKRLKGSRPGATPHKSSPSQIFADRNRWELGHWWRMARLRPRGASARPGGAAGAVNFESSENFGHAPPSLKISSPRCSEQRGVAPGDQHFFFNIYMSALPSLPVRRAPQPQPPARPPMPPRVAAAVENHFFLKVPLHLGICCSFLQRMYDVLLFDMGVVFAMYELISTAATTVNAGAAVAAASTAAVAAVSPRHSLSSSHSHGQPATPTYDLVLAVLMPAARARARDIGACRMCAEWRGPRVRVARAVCGGPSRVYEHGQTGRAGCSLLIRPSPRVALVLVYNAHDAGHSIAHR